MLDQIALTKHVSATQLSNYALCPRKWGYNKLNGLPDKPNKYAERGTAVHKALEDYNEGLPVDFTTDIGKIISPGLKFLPAPKVAKSEQDFHLETETAIYVGRMDLSRILVNWSILRIHILDHKTTTDFKWLKTPEQLRKDYQANLYAVAALTLALQDPKAPPNATMETIEVQQDWVYYRADPKKPAARKVQLHVLPSGVQARPDKHVRPEHFGVMGHAELGERFQEIETLAAELLDHHRQGHKAEDLPVDLRGCNAFGGCHYRNNPCKLTFGQEMKARMEQAAKESLADKLKAQLAKQGGGAAAKPAATATATQTKASATAKAEDTDAAKAVAKQAEVANTTPKVNPPENGKAASAPSNSSGPIPSPAPSAFAQQMAAQAEQTTEFYKTIVPQFIQAFTDCFFDNNATDNGKHLMDVAKEILIASIKDRALKSDEIVEFAKVAAQSVAAMQAILFPETAGGTAPTITPTPQE